MRSFAAGQTRTGQQHDAKSSAPVKPAAAQSNASAMRWIGAPFVQAKLRIGDVDDPLEREADHVADAVLAGSHVPSLGAIAAQPQAKCADCEEAEGAARMKQAVPAAAAVPAEAPAIVHEALRSPAQPLDAATRAYFEPRFGHDFGGVRIHTDALSVRSAAMVGARAYARGADIVYGAGELQGVNRLTAHELAHVAQSRLAAVPNVIRRAPGDEPGRAGKDFKIVSDVWEVEGRPVVVVESGGKRTAFYQRSSSDLKGRLEGNAGPQKNDWAPFDGFKDNGKGAGHFQKENYYNPYLARYLRYGYGSAEHRRTATWLAKQILPEPIPEPWTYVQSRLQSKGVKVRTPLQNPIPERLAPVSPPARTALGGIDTSKPRPTRGTPPGGGGRGGGGAVFMGVLTAAFALSVPLIKDYFARHYLHEKWSAEQRAMVSEAIEGSAWKYAFLIGSRLSEIQKEQAEGRQVRLHVEVVTEWVGTDFGPAQTKAEVSSYGLLFEGDTPIEWPLFQPKRGVGANLFHTPVRTFRRETYDFVL